MKNPMDDVTVNIEHIDTLSLVNPSYFRDMEQKVKQNAPVKFQVRPITTDDYPQVQQIFKQAGWLVGVNSIPTWREIDPEGWKVAVKSSGEVLGFCSAAQLTDEFCHLKYYIVKEQYRGRGVGLKLWNACIDYIGPRNACMMSIQSMVQNYKSKCGFSFIDEDATIIYETRDEIQVQNLSSEVPEGVSIVPFEDSHLAALIEYDPFHGNYTRQRIIELTCKEKDSKTLVAFKDGACVGFGTIKNTLLDILTVKPMYVDDASIAEVMLKKLLLSFPNGRGFSIRSFAANKAIRDMMEKIGCSKDIELYHMYTRMNCTQFRYKSLMHKLFGLLECDLLDF